MSDKAKKILRLYGESRKRIMRATELNDEIEILKVALYEPSTAKIKEEHELGSGGFNNAYKTPKLAQMERMTEVEKELKKITDLEHDLINKIELMEEETGCTLMCCYVDKSITLTDRSYRLGVHRNTVYRNLISEIERVYEL